MKTTITSLCIALALTLGASSPALADRGHRDHDRYYGNRHDYGPPRHYQQHREYRRSWVGPAAVLAITGIAAGVALAAVATAWIAGKFRRWLGGYTGDCLGTAQQVAEIGFYLGMLAVWPS